MSETDLRNVWSEAEKSENLKNGWTFKDGTHLIRNREKMFLLLISSLLQDSGFRKTCNSL